MQYDFRPHSQNTGRTAHAIFETEQSASEAVNASPVNIPTPDRSSTLFKPMPIWSDFEHRNDDIIQNPPSLWRRNHIRCLIRPSQHDHSITISQNPYHNCFHVTSHSHEVNDLRRTIPPLGAPSVEYVDCFAGRKRALSPQLQQAVLEENAKLGGSSLMGLWEQGVEERKREEERRKEKEEDKKSTEENNMGNHMSSQT